MKGFLLEEVAIKGERDQKGKTIPKNTRVEIIRFEYLPSEIQESIGKFDRDAIKSGKKVIFWFGGFVIIEREKIDMPKYLNGGYNR